MGTHSRRASVEVKREFSFLLSFSDNELDAGASRLHSHAGAWERETDNFLTGLGETIMPYGQFATIGQVAETFGITLRKKWFLQDVKKNSIEVPDYKQAEIKKRLSNTAALKNEAARCNQIITPILNIVVDEHEPLQLWIEESFNVDEDNGLTGTPDYLIAPETAGEEMAIPPICVIEAKQDKFDEGWTQALAEMVAASLKGSTICFGIVTTGKAWEFGLLENRVFTREPDQVTTRDLQDLFDTLNWIVSLAEKEIKE